MVLKEFGCELDYEGKDFRKKVGDVWWKIIREEKSELAALANNTGNIHMVSISVFSL